MDQDIVDRDLTENGALEVFREHDSFGTHASIVSSLFGSLAFYMAGSRIMA